MHPFHWLVLEAKAALLALARSDALDEPALAAKSALHLIAAREAALPMGTLHLGPPTRRARGTRLAGLVAALVKTLDGLGKGFAAASGAAAASGGLTFRVRSALACRNRRATGALYATHGAALCRVPCRVRRVLRWACA